MPIKRVCVQKKSDFDVQATDLRNDICVNLKIPALESVNKIICYDIELPKEISEESFMQCKQTVFAELPVDEIFNDNYPELLQAHGGFVFAVKYLPGQYDQRADSAVQCVRAVTGMDDIAIETMDVYCFKGKLSQKDREKIKKYCINPVDSEEVPLSIPEHLNRQTALPPDESIINIIELKDDEISEKRHNLGLAMNDDDLLFCRDYFRDEEHRNPTMTEIRLLDTYWSDHCRHTTFLTELSNIAFEEGKYSKIIKDAFDLYKSVKSQEKPITLMDIATAGMKELKRQGYLNDLDESDEINACSINAKVSVGETEEDWLILFKNETHNHPTEIEPFGGAATCLGGAIRDPLSGRAYVYQAMRVSGSADPTVPVEQTLRGKLPQLKITRDAAKGFSSYGNQIGLATGIVTELYDEGYKAKRLETGAVVGAVKKDCVKREKPAPGDVIILIGGRTGRDGCGGATGSSKAHDEKSVISCGAEVQKGNPPTERKLQRLFRNKEASLLIRRCNDFGAGGVSVAIGELADGININLDLIPKKYEGLSGTELAISESQERMAVVVAKEDSARFITLAEEENLEATVVAEVTEEPRLVMFWRGQKIADISRKMLDSNGARRRAAVYVTDGGDVSHTEKTPIDIKQWVLDELAKLTNASQKGLGSLFDSTIGAGSIFMPFGGKNQLTPQEVMAAKVPVQTGNTTTATVMSFGCSPKYASISPFHGAVYAVCDSLAKIAASGADANSARLSFQEYFERLGDDPVRWGKPLAAMLGAFWAQMQFKTAAIGGKDSMSGTFGNFNVPPTLISFALAVDDCKKLTSPEFKKVGSTIVLFEAQYDNNDIPVFDSIIRLFSQIKKLIEQRKIISVHTISDSALIPLFKMAFGNFIGAEVMLSEELFFGTKPKFGSFIAEVPLTPFEIFNQFKDVDYKIIGRTTDTAEINANFVKIPLSEALSAWTNTFESVFPTQAVITDYSANIKLKPHISSQTLKSRTAFAKPVVLMPVFPGTNCEYDMERAFIHAGAEVDTFVIKNLTAAHIKESVRVLADKVKNSQILAFSGGFSAGDEPDGSGKFIAAVFRNVLLAEAVTELLEVRGGLVLGICNGFQALIKLGLVPFGKITAVERNSPTLTFNAIGRHRSAIARTKIISNTSPWLYNTNVGDVYSIPVSHGEGRFSANMQTIAQLAKSGQIATQYVNLSGDSSMETDFNPNGSTFAIEGITSPDGRVFGKMGHSERIGAHLYKNVAGEYNQKIFESGVGYFK
ncbi:MAG: phosphoribosylformylglycinamidine synthase [Clostridiales bacterium]|jgi:phosphoribosylformylglycinamidine synthase|nr:phosphoribosylformylglycinamidine synthase [Clostridiales bacterium]